MTDEAKSAGALSADVSPDCLCRAEQIIYDYQRARLEATYADFSHYSDLHEYFFGLLYPPPDVRPKFAARNRTYTRIAGSRLLRMIFHPVTMRVMNQIAELDRMTEAMNRKFARSLCERGPLPDSIDDGIYFELCRKTTATAQHEKQFDFVYEGFYFGELVIKHIKMDLKDMMRLIPKSLMRNIDLLDLATRTYYTFRSHKNELETFRLTMHERELAYIGRIFGITIDKKPLIYTGNEE
jgi:hypothetical protein